MKLNRSLKTLVVIAMLVLVASMAVAQDVETQENPDDLEDQVENQTELPEEANIRLPGDRFYGLTQASERFELAVVRAPVFGDEDREARTLANHADRRIAESEALAERGDSNRSSQAIERYSEAMERATQAAENSSNNETKERIAEATSRQEETLQRVSEQVPEEAQQGIQTAMDNIQNARELHGPPEDVGPGEQGPMNESPGQGQPNGEQDSQQPNDQQPDESNQTTPDDEQEIGNETESGNETGLENDSNQEE